MIDSCQMHWFNYTNEYWSFEQANQEFQDQWSAISGILKNAGISSGSNRSSPSEYSCGHEA
jgi:hypothetical protein